MVIPDGLEGMAPGAELAVVLASIDVGGLSGYHRVVCHRLTSGDHHWTGPLGHTYTTSRKPP